MKEFELIARLARLLPGNASVVTGVGDDCAVLDVGIPDRWLLFKTDAVMEGIHFKAETDPEKIGHKALARCLSDIAAMAGTPLAALVTLALPKNFAVERVEAVYRGMQRLAESYGVAIPGGETIASNGGMLVSISMIGTVARDKAISRSGAKPGDALFVTGELGGSLAGRHLDFEPRLQEARWLADSFAIHSMIDLSDGMAGDLRHILAASNVGAELFSPAIPISRAARSAFRDKTSTKPPLLAALTDGEDFELLFTVASKEAIPLLDGWKKQFPALRCSCIGKIIKGKGIHLRDKDGVRPLSANGYTHFP
jgi:thiamine-monophosphate kinase